MKSVKKPDRLKLSLLQVPGNDHCPLKSLELIENMLKNYKRSQIDIFILPEMWPSGFDLQKYREQEPKYQDLVFRLKEIARKKSAYFLGSLPQKRGNKIYNTALLINPRGEAQTKYHKMHLFTLQQEEKNFVAGHQIQTCAIKGVKCGLSICYDLRFPEMFRSLVLKRKAKVIFVLAAWPKSRLDHWQLLLRARAIENQVFVVAVNKVGKDPRGLDFAGYSQVIDPWGQVIASLGSKQAILDQVIEISLVDEIRKKYPFLQDSRF